MLPDQQRPLRLPAVLAGLLVACFAGACGRTADESPTASGAQTSVILISLDTCRADSLGFLGAARKTPALDALSEGSVVFEDCFAQSSSTAPSHLSILTGQHVQRHGLLKNGERSTPLYTLASLLRDKGYRTAAFTGHGSLQAKFGHGVGFEQFVSWQLGSEPSNAEGAAPYQRYFAEAAEEGLAWLDELGPEEAFFLFVHGYDPHMPFWPQEPRRTEFAGWYEGELDISKIYKLTEFAPIIESGRLGDEERRYIRDLYDAEIGAADESIGGFLRALEERGLFEEAIIVFLSDHGELLGEHDAVGHGLFFEEVSRVPLMLRFPGAQWAGRHAQTVQHIDVAPTLLSALQLPRPPGMQGLDLMPLIRGEAATETEDRMFIGQRDRRFALRFSSAPELRILFRRLGAGDIREVEVYDVERDPDQLRDLARDRTLLERLRKLLTRYQKWSDQSAREDGAYRGEESGIQAEDVDMLRALGYLGDDEDAE